jgi:ankyrin repeat protein
LERACFYGCEVSIFRRLCELSGSTTLHEKNHGYSLLHFAAARGWCNLIGELLDQGYGLEDYSVRRSTPLLEAVREGKLDATKVLIGRGADINVIDVSGWDVTHHACFGGHLEILKLIREHGLKTTHRVEVESTILRAASCLHIAAFNGHSDILEYLLIHCGDSHSANEVAEDNITVLYVAVSGSFLDTVSTLIDYGADVEISRNGKTPLHLASEQGLEDITRLLLSAGADLEKRDSKGYSPEVCALKAEQHGVIKILREFHSRQGTCNCRN